MTGMMKYLSEYPGGRGKQAVSVGLGRRLAPSSWVGKTVLDPSLWVGVPYPGGRNKGILRLGR